MTRYFKGTTTHIAADNFGNMFVLSGASDPEKADVVLSLSANFLPTFDTLYRDAKAFIAQQQSLGQLRKNANLPLYIRSLTDDALTEMVNDAVEDLNAASVKWGVPVKDIEKLFGI